MDLKYKMAEEQEQPQEELTEDQIAERLSSYIGTTPTPEEKQNVHTFLHNVAVADNTTKTGNLEKEELGIPLHPVRTYQELALFCKEIANMDYFSDYFKKKAEITTATSLSRDAKLLNLAVMQKREIAEIAPKPRRENKSWFKKKEPRETYGEPTV